MPDVRRIDACVSFCQHLPTETLEKLLAIRVGAATALQWLRRQQHGYRDVTEMGEEVICWECSHLEPQHSENCLLGKAVELVP